MKTLLAKTAALAALLLGLGGTAQATEGWYGRVDGGYSFDGNIDDGDDEFDLSDDWMASAGLGYAFAGGFRLEGELGYRNNEVDGTSQEAEVLSLMANAYYDFNRGGFVEPYIGAGVGAGQLEVSPSIFDGETGLAWQAMAGLAFSLGDRADLDIGYRYFSMPSVEFPSFDAEYQHQAVTIGLRWQFAAPPPPPVAPAPPPVSPPPPPPMTPPPPAVCPAQDFVVYFEWDRSNLNQAALETIDAAVARARQCNISSVVVVGHTDTSGSTAYNQGLSERRAGVVRDALTSRGIAAASIRTEARGETDLARATRDGVREPLNRRTAVVISFR